MIEKNKCVFVKQCKKYCVLHHAEYHATYACGRDALKIFDAMDAPMELASLHRRLRERRMRISLEELEEFINFWAELGVVDAEGVAVNPKEIAAHNQYEDFIDYCYENDQPTVLHVELTNACNLNCIHCFHDEAHEWAKYEDLERVFQSLKNSTFVRVTLTGGEVGLHPQWKEIMASAKENGLSVALLSNLTCFQREDLDYIAAMKPLLVRTSLYGASAQTHDSITGIQNSFDKTVNNMLYLRDRGVAVEAFCTVMKQNTHEILALDTYSKELGLSLKFGYQIFPSRRNTKRVEDLMVDSSVYDDLLKAGILKPEQETSCKAGGYRIAIDPAGNIYSCDMLRIPIGNVKTVSVMDALRGNTMRRIRKAIRKYNPKSCKSCPRAAKCFRCPGHVWNYDPYVNEASPVHCLYAKVSSCEKRG